MRLLSLRRFLVCLAVALLAAQPAHAVDNGRDDHPRAENSLCPITGGPIDPSLPPVALTVSGRTHWLGFSSSAAAEAGRRDPAMALDRLAKLQGQGSATTPKPSDPAGDPKPPKKSTGAGPAR